VSPPAAQGHTKRQDETGEIGQRAHHRQAQIFDIDGGELQAGPRGEPHGTGHLRVGVSDGGRGRQRSPRPGLPEFDASSKIWHAFVDAHMKTQQAIIDYKSFPDLNQLSSEDLAAFLESTELSKQQCKQVAEASDKVTMFSKITRLRSINAASVAIYDGRLLLRTSGIFIPAEMAKAFKDGFDTLSEAQAEQYINFRHGGAGHATSMRLVGSDGEKLLGKLETLVRTTIRREMS